MVSIGRKSTIIEMEIMGRNVTETIVDWGLDVNVLLEEAMKYLGKPTLWLPTFHLVGVDQHDFKPLGTLMAQKVTIGTQCLFLDFIFIQL